MVYESMGMMTVRDVSSVCLLVKVTGTLKYLKVKVMVKGAKKHRFY